MVEIRSSKDTHNRYIVEEAYAAQVCCQAASERNADHSGKPWTYALSPHDKVYINSSFDFLIRNQVPEEQVVLPGI